MPGVTARLRAQKPEIAREDAETLGAQLRQRRREFGHRRIDAARLIGVDPKSLTWWERDEREPLDRSWPALIAYLGRVPWPPPTSLSEQLLAERRRRGLAIFEAAAAAGVDETTFRWWESGRRLPRYPRTKALVARFLSLADARGHDSPVATDLSPGDPLL